MERAVETAQNLCEMNNLIPFDMLFLEVDIYSLDPLIHPSCGFTFTGELGLEHTDSLTFMLLMANLANTK